MKHPTYVAVAFVCFFCLVLLVPAETNDKDVFVYSFESVAWSLREEFGFQVGLLKGTDGGLIGLCLRIWNNSSENPLALRTLGRFPSPFSAEIRINDGAPVVARAQLRGSTAGKEAGATPVEWTLAPRFAEYYFISAGDFFPAHFDLPVTQRAKVWAHVTTQAKNVRPTREHEPARLPYTEILITRASLALDGHAVFRDWCKKLAQSR